MGRYNIGDDDSMINKIWSVLTLITIGIIIWGEYILLHGFFDSALSGTLQAAIVYIIVFLIVFVLFVYTDIIVFILLFGTAIALWDE